MDHADFITRSKWDPDIEHMLLPMRTKMVELLGTGNIVLYWYYLHALKMIVFTDAFLKRLDVTIDINLPQTHIDKLCRLLSHADQLEHMEHLFDIRHLRPRLVQNTLDTIDYIRTHPDAPPLPPNPA